MKKITAFTAISPIVMTGALDIPRSKSNVAEAWLPSAALTGIQHDAERDGDAAVERPLSMRREIEDVTIQQREFAIEFADYAVAAEEYEIRAQKQEYRNSGPS